MRSNTKTAIISLWGIIAVLVGQWVGSVEAKPRFYSPIIIEGEVGPLEFSLTPFPPTPTPTRAPDYSPPETGLEMQGIVSAHNWYRTPVTVTFKAEDEVSTSSTNFSKDS